MGLLNEQQIALAIESMKEYMSALNSEGKTTAGVETDIDQKRELVIESKLKPLLHNYLDGNIALSDFKSKVDSINKKNEHWGFKGIKGQMFFNIVFNVADDIEECSSEIKSAITLPENEQIASSRIKNFISYVKRLGDQWVEAGNDKRGTPKISSIPFFLSYFWQIQNRDEWPVYYTNSVNMMQDLNLWQPSGDLAQDYLSFKRIHEELAELFSRNSSGNFDLYKVEHVFWYKGNKIDISTTTEDEGTRGKSGVLVDSPNFPDQLDLPRLPESYVPPIISVLVEMANNNETLIQAAKNSGTSLERAFEKYIDIAFKILGYETRLMGQGSGRVPDGSAAAYDDSYTILWDAKIRSNGYSMGTDDRTIREYITTQSRELKRRRSLKNIYYAIISSNFADDYDEAIRSIKMDTDVNEVLLMEVSALVAMVEAKLRDPTITLGSNGFQHLFSSSGVIKTQTVKDQFS
jgi:hypothetical protein